MQTLANILQFEALQAAANQRMGSSMAVFNDNGFALADKVNEEELWADLPEDERRSIRRHAKKSQEQLKSRMRQSAESARSAKHDPDYRGSGYEEAMSLAGDFNNDSLSLDEAVARIRPLLDEIGAQNVVSAISENPSPKASQLIGALGL